MKSPEMMSLCATNYQVTYFHSKAKGLYKYEAQKKKNQNFGKCCSLLK